MKTLFWKFLIWRLEKMYGADCEIPLDDNMDENGCASCQAHYVIQFLKRHIELYKL